MRAGGASLVALALLGGCAGSSLTLLPDEGGGSGAVAVLESGGRAQETVVDRANSRTRLDRRNTASRDIDPARLSARERDALDNLPPPAASYTLYFFEGGTRLVPSSEVQIEAMFADVKARPGADVQVTGHTDTLGSEADNDLLSQRRAEEIRELLVARGLDADIVSAVGRGERQLREPTEDGVRNAANRRVEVIVR